MKFLDLFSGIGGFRSGMEKAGHECVGYVEIDKFARKSYQEIYDTKGEYTEYDITKVKGSELPKADIWCFGFPCQDISVAGKQKGFTGNRSSLFFATTRILRELKEDKKPSYLLIENVKNLLSVNRGWDFAKLQIELDEIGYDVEWDVLDTAEVLPQHRERIYIVGHLRGRSTRKVFPIRRQSKNFDTRKINKVGNVNTSGKGINGEVIDVNGVSKTVSTNKGEGQKIAVKAKIKRVFDGRKNGTYGSQDVVDPSGISNTLNTMGGGNREPKIAIPVLTPDRINKRQNGRRFKNNEEPEFTLTGQDRHGIYNGIRIRKLTPLECWRLQGFTDEQFHKAEKVNSNSQLYKQAGNSVSVPVIYEIAKRM